LSFVKHQVSVIDQFSAEVPCPSNNWSVSKGKSIRRIEGPMQEQFWQEWLNCRVYIRASGTAADLLAGVLLP